MSAQNWLSTQDGLPSTPVRSNGGGGTQIVGFRSVLDARRAMLGQRAPSAEYPDGYLGTIIDRRQDKLLKEVQNRLTSRSYQRGVHKGERVDPRDYRWNGDVDPQAGLRAEARGEKWTAAGATPQEKLAHMGKVDALTPQEMDALYQKFGVDPSMRDLTVASPERQSRLAELRPRWR